MTLNAGKIYGPKQVGLLWRQANVRLRPFIHGGGQERGLRSGTENVPGVIGFAMALELAQRHRKSETRRLEELRNGMQRQIIAAIPDVVISGDQKRRLASHLHVSFPGIDAERLIFILEQQHIYVATGSACAANAGMRSHVLQAIGLVPDAADGSLRITLGCLSNQAICERGTVAIIAAVQSERARTRR